MTKTITKTMTKTITKTMTKTITKTMTKTITKTTTKQEAIIEIIAQNPCISTKELAEQLNITIPDVRYHLIKMKKAGLTRYKGSAKLGRWIIVK